jgi:plasmid replication initiation protein
LQGTTPEDVMTAAVQQLALDLSVDSPLIGKVKTDRRLMVWNFFSLTRDRVTELPVYDDGQVRIEVTGSKHGIATIWDKEILIYLASLVQDKINRGEQVSPTLTFTAHDVCRVIGVKVAGTAYDRIEQGLLRLQSTTVRTNIETGGEGADEAFSWILRYKIHYRRGRTGEKVMRAIEVELCPWVYRAILKDRWMLTYNHKYFELPPLEKRLYEIARAHVGKQAGFKMNLEKLRLRVGTTNDLRRFKAELLKISKRKQPLPDYGLSVIDPRLARMLDAKAAAPLKRAPLKSLLVYFFSTDRLSVIPAPSVAPMVDNDLPEDEEL